jgi:hypothetical protein
MTQRKYRRGDVFFNKDEPASEMFLTVSIPNEVIECTD